MKQTEFAEFAAVSAILNGLVVLLFSVFFLWLRFSIPEFSYVLSAHLLVLSGLLAIAVNSGLFMLVKKSSEGFALWAYGLGLLASLGVIVTGGHDLANSVGSIDGIPALLTDVVNPANPRGLMLFGVGGLSVLAWSWLVKAGGNKLSGWFGYLLGLSMISWYFLRAVGLEPTHTGVVVFSYLIGFLLYPLWSFLVAQLLWRSKK